MATEMEAKYCNLLYLSVSMHAAIGQFSWPYSPVQPTKFTVGFVAKLFCDLSIRVLNFYSISETLQLSYTLNYVIKHANDLKNVSN